MEQSLELTAFKNDFEFSTNIRVDGVEENQTFFHWKRLIFDKLDCEQMEEIARYIRRRFTTKGQYSHLLPALHSYNNRLMLTVDSSFIQKFILNTK